MSSGICCPVTTLSDRIEINRAIMLLDVYPKLFTDDIRAAINYAADVVEHEELIAAPDAS